MGNALKNWLDTHGLPAIFAAIFGVIFFLSVLLVGGGYLMVTR
jgi:hypothetical protein